ncbi:E3 ubiquitin-protein ligase ZNF598 isoform X3 [Myotis daubentonii]|uniref:E3 ubiquitin-protein ligase ZNF598 isoform X3 n=1 Tax=Myotis daubentonii TaxID=98922 RepID=UPI002873866E|nr:E3 ubiquitin-protein ligase ZNF598 isoform X3 [Myotis daubentonii]
MSGDLRDVRWRQSSRRQTCYSNRRFSGAEIAPALPPGWAVVGRGADVAPEGAGPPGDWRRRAGREGAGALTMAAGADADSRRAALEAATVAPERGGGSCVLCCGDLEATALGRCDHPVCYRCSTKMRVLCEQRYCAVCREELRQVVFGKKLPAFATVRIDQLQHEKKYDIYFADGKVYALFRQLLQHECPRCPELPPFGLFGDLEQHMRKQHELFCCKLCLKHLKIFTYERKWYSRKDLARHRMQGDPDDTSHRGHPLCKFCDERYLDNDELLKHLRRDHYFCHFCDSDGAQDYYSDYAYLREHFREKHFLCEEGRCSTEQFTHAFRTEIDLKAHKTACHSRSRAEARQNRQIDLQFSYTPRHSRRNEGTVSGEDYEEVDRYNRQGRAGRASGRGAQQSRRGSWRYKREEEDREVAAAIRASVATQQQQEIHKSPKEASTNGPVSQEAFPANTSAAGATHLSTLPPSTSKLKDEDFPSLCTSTSSSCSTATAPGPVGLALVYPVPTRGRSTFQEDDFPALVSSTSKPSTAPTSLISAWNSSGSKKVVQPAPGVQAAGGGSQPPRKAGKGGKGNKKGGPPPPEEEEEEDSRTGLTTQELRSVPTTVAVSSLLALASTQTFTKVGKKKKVGSEKLGATSPLSLPPEKDGPPGAEQAPPAPKGRAEGPVAVIVNGHTEGPAPAWSVPKEPPGLPRPLGPLPCPTPQEDFPALGGPCLPRMPPPPGFSTVVLLKGTPPPPPPGLAPQVSKPPPGFSGLPSPNPACVPSTTTTTKASRLTPAPRAYLVPENFRERNLQLIQSIKDFLQSDEARFSEFKSHSGEFRQGVISAAQYYKSCRDLLGENFQKIFNELLVLLPDTAKQQELLSAHTDFRGQERLPGTKAKKNKKNAWQASTQQADLDCCVCPTCQQVLANGDFRSHQALHTARDDDFPSLQAVARTLT